MISKTFKTFLLASSIVGGFAFTAQAKEPDAYFYPAKSWNSEAGQAGGSGQCAMGTEFNNGFVLGFSGAEQGVTNMNMDFRQDAFQPGQTYQAVLSIPGGATINVPAKASAKNLLDVNVLGQKELLKSLKANPILDFSVEGNNLRFYMTGFTGAIKTFENCMASKTSSVKSASSATGGTYQGPYGSAAKNNKGAQQAPQDLTINESIALEQQESGRTSPGNAPTPQQIQQQVPQQPAQPGNLQNMPENVRKNLQQTMDPSAQQTVQAAAPGLKMPPQTDAQPASPVADSLSSYAPTNVDRRRMSEKVEEKIAANPEIAKIQDTPPNARLGQQDLTEPPFMRNPAPQPPQQQASAAPTPVAQEAAPVMAQPTLAEPPAQSELPVPTAATPAIAEATPIATVPAQPILSSVAASAPPAPVINMPSAKPGMKIYTSANLPPSAAAALKAQGGIIIPPGSQQPAASPQTAPVAAPPTEPMAIGGSVESMASGEKIVFNQPRTESAMPVTAPAPETSASAEFAESDALPLPGEKQESLKPANDSKPVMAQPTFATPPDDTAKKPEVIKTPAMKVDRQVYNFDADMTKAGLDTPPAQIIEDGNEPFSGKRPALSSRSAAGQPLEQAPSAYTSGYRPDPEMSRKISDLEQALADLKKQNSDLSSELNGNLQATQKEQVSIASENWNLEKASQRYTESEMEVKRLGQQLQQERARWAMEKQELEAQLFDPQLTSQKQLARLAELEQQLAEAQHQLEATRARQSGK